MHLYYSTAECTDSDGALLLKAPHTVATPPSRNCPHETVLLHGALYGLLMLAHITNFEPYHIGYTSATQDTPSPKRSPAETPLCPSAAPVLTVR